MTGQRRQFGFLPGFVMEMYLAIGALGVAVALLLPWHMDRLKARTLEASASGFVVVPAAEPARVPPAWTLSKTLQDSIVIQRDEHEALRWLVPVLLGVTIAGVFMFAIELPFWLLLAALCGTWGYAVVADPVEQSVTINADRSLELRAGARFAGALRGRESVAAKEFEAVVVHRETGEVQIVFARERKKLGWVLYTDSNAEARAFAALLQSILVRSDAQPKIPSASAGAKER